MTAATIKTSTNSRIIVENDRKCGLRSITIVQALNARNVALIIGGRFLTYDFTEMRLLFLADRRASGVHRKYGGAFCFSATHRRDSGASSRRAEGALDRTRVSRRD